MIAYTPEEIELMKLDYEISQEGYNSRDEMTYEVFHKLILIFQLFLVILFSTMIFLKVSREFHIISSVIVGFAGLLSMFSMLVGLESLVSTKAALRLHSIELEKEISKRVSDRVSLQYWDKLKKRDKYFEERNLKRGEINIKNIRHTLIWTSRVLIAFWIAIVAFTIIYSDNIMNALENGKNIALTSMSLIGIVIP